MVPIHLIPSCVQPATLLHLFGFRCHLQEDRCRLDELSTHDAAVRCRRSVVFKAMLMA
jgi:hypothetical protein